MFIICSLIRIRASWEKFVFSLCTNFFCPKGPSAVPAKPELSICMVSCGSGFVWTSVLSHSSPEAVVAATSLYPCSLLLDRSMSSASWCLAGLCQSPCSSEFAALSIAALSLCSSWQQEHHLPRFFLHLWLLFPELKPAAMNYWSSQRIC